MTTFGGRSKFGRAAFGGDPYGFEPGHVLDCIIYELSRFLRQGESGYLRTLDWLTSDLDDEESIDRQLVGGAPAMLVGYVGGPFSTAKTTSGKVFRQTMGFVIVCVADQFDTPRDRLRGRNIYSSGLYTMTRHAIYWGGRALLDIDGLENPRPADEGFLRFKPEKYISVVKFAAESAFDLSKLHDDVEYKLERLGICHSPIDLNHLFKEDNQTPNTDDPTGFGVADLNVE